MDFRQFQKEAARTDQRRGEGEEGMVVHLLGLAGEAGSVASEYKKFLRDGPAHGLWKARMREELGDVIWYVAAICTHLGLDLNDVAWSNLEKTRNRWLLGDLDVPSKLDADYPAGEQLPRSGVVEFSTRIRQDGTPMVSMSFAGEQIGDDLSDASRVEDGYRYHDVFHLSYAVLLGWSPVTRLLMRRKRKSVPAIDEAEDGGRAIALEEGVSALVFGYAAQHEFLRGVSHVDQWLLDAIDMLTGQTEVGVRSAAAWERAILSGFEVWRALSDAGTGRIVFDADAALFAFEPSETE